MGVYLEKYVEISTCITFRWTYHFHPLLLEDQNPPLKGKTRADWLIVKINADFVLKKSGKTADYFSVTDQPPSSPKSK